MNKRILELAEQAGFHVARDGKIYIPTTSEEITVELERFSQLIVEDCLKKCQEERDKSADMAAANNGRQSDMAFGVVTGVERVALEIIKQFEV